MEQISQLIAYSLGPIRTRGLLALIPRGNPSRVLIVYWTDYVRTWVIWGFSGVLLAYFLTSSLGNSYFLESAKQMLAPLFWNIVVVLGLLFVLFGALAYAVQWQNMSSYFFRSSYAFLKFSSEVGALGFGALLGLLFIASYESGFSGFIDYVRLVMGMTLLGITLVLNLIVWWVTYCLHEDVETPEYFRYIGQRKRLLAALCIVSIIGISAISANTTPISSMQLTAFGGS
ncbi:hypothetical protein [Alteromonas sp. a30]|uniref:hypothetical protein n=1 Tax=Alteromonas sp. a30 TaxID=2730917 RepID=UPI00227FE22D|nr:hypothetical protein [Alteromonas sp. a30]MCY7297480.1 hypothetical protein [Alteromonas sp. a30]